VTLHRPFAAPTPEAVGEFIAAVPLYRADDDPTFWSDDRLRDRQDELLRRQLSWIAAGSAFYQRHFTAHGVDPSAVKTVDDLVGLPVTTKADLMDEPAAFRLRLSDAGLYDLTYATVYTTGTTTGRPTPYEYTTHDFYGVLQSNLRLNKLTYFVPGDLTLCAFPLSPVPHVGGAAFMALMTGSVQSGFLHGFTGVPYPEFPIHRPAADLAASIESLRPQVLMAVGSFARRLLVDAADDGRDFSSLRLVVVGGEVMTRQMRAHMRDHLRRLGAADVYIAANYGYTEAALSCGPCHEESALHNSAPDQIFYEILDEQTHERVPDGQPGLVAITHLNRRGMPLVRYLLGDRSSLSHRRCPACGRGGQSLTVSAGSAHVSRSGDLLKVKGTLINPAVIHDVVMNTPGVLEYQLVVTNETEGDALTPEVVQLRVSAAGDGIGDRLREAIFHATEIRPTIELVDDPSAIYDPRNEFKARRVIDRRPVA
jgi:phenylacetate-CoA ligase